jgi:hypothetical protein
MPSTTRPTVSTKAGQPTSLARSGLTAVAIWYGAEPIRKIGSAESHATSQHGDRCAVRTPPTELLVEDHTWWPMTRMGVAASTINDRQLPVTPETETEDLACIIDATGAGASATQPRSASWCYSGMIATASISTSAPGRACPAVETTVTAVR